MWPKRGRNAYGAVGLQMYNHLKAKFSVNGPLAALAVRDAIAVTRNVVFVLPRSFPDLASVALLVTEIQNTNRMGNALTVVRGIFAPDTSAPPPSNCCFIGQIQSNFIFQNI